MGAIDIADFLQIEKKYDLYHQEIDGIQPWQFYRMGFWNYQICSDLLGLSENIVRQKKVELIHKKLIRAFKLLFMRNRLKQADLLFLAHERRVRNGEYFECVYTDRLAKKYSSNVVLERPYRKEHLRPVEVRNIFYTDFIGIKEKVYYTFHSKCKTGKYKNILKQIERKYKDALVEISQIYQIYLDYQKAYERLAKIVLENIIMKREYNKIIKKVSPKIIVEAVYYNSYCMVVNELAKQKGIPTVELQHGTMHSAHAAYQFPDGCGAIEQFPDYVYVFSEYWKKCAHLPIAEDHIIITGYPYFERQLNKYKTGCDKGDRINIIFVSQGTVGKELSRLAADLYDLLDKNRYHIIYKLHPGEYAEWKERNPWLLKNDIEVVDSLEHNIYEYFARCHIQVGVYSTAIYEGLGFGLTTYIYNIAHADTMVELCEQGYAAYVNNAEELYQDIVIDNINGHKDGKEFWKLNSFENICSEIDKLLK